MDYLVCLRTIIIYCRHVGNLNINYDGGSGSDLQLYFQSSLGERNGKFSQNRKLGQNSNTHLSLNVSSSIHDCGCVVDDGDATAAILLLYKKIMSKKIKSIIIQFCLYKINIILRSYIHFPIIYFTTSEVHTALHVCSG